MFADRLFSHFPPGTWPTSGSMVQIQTGLSGSALYRFQSAAGVLLAARKWPQEHPSQARLAWIHQCIQHAQAQGISFLSVPCQSSAGLSFVELDGALWQLEPWLPGAAEESWSPPATRVAAALAALADLHAALDRPARGGHALPTTFPAELAPMGVYPAVADRLQLLQWADTEGLIKLRQACAAAATARHSRPPAYLIAAAHEIPPLLARWIAPCQAALRPHLARPAADTHWGVCLRDIWQPHVLFSGNVVTGMVDYGAMRPDHRHTDVARLLGSLAKEEPQLWQAGLSAYESRSGHPLDGLLVRALDVTNVVLGCLNWLRWQLLEGRQFDVPALAEASLQSLIRRLKNNDFGQDLRSGL